MSLAIGLACQPLRRMVNHEIRGCYGRSLTGAASKDWHLNVMLFRWWLLYLSQDGQTNDTAVQTTVALHTIKVRTKPTYCASLHLHTI